MGIRFFCPNGHKLNVKEQQAGQRGKCPKCGVKLLIPQESTRVSSKELRHRKEESVMDGFMTPPDEVSLPRTTRPPRDSSASDIIHQANVVRTNDPVINFEGPVQHDPLETEDLPHVMIPAEEDAPKEYEADESEKPDPLDEDPTAIWYVKPPEGGQYGPAESEIMRQWIDERRIHPDSDVWREGWSEWEKATVVFPVLAELFTEDQDPPEEDEPFSAIETLAAPPAADEEAPVRVAAVGNDPSSHIHQKPTRRETRMRTIAIVVVMTLAIVMLGGALAYVLIEGI
jgi:hypothetical protein